MPIAIPPRVNSRNSCIWPFSSRPARPASLSALPVLPACPPSPPCPACPACLPSPPSETQVVAPEPDVGRQGRRVVLGDHLAEVEHQALVGDAEGAAGVLLDQQHSQPGVVAQLPDQVHDLRD